MGKRMLRFLLPKRPSKNFKEFCATLNSSGKANIIPCLGCHGRGWKYDPSERCPIEGYKLATQYPCGKCNGTGKGEEGELRVLYGNAIIAWRKQCNEIHKKNFVLKNANRLPWYHPGAHRRRSRDCFDPDGFEMRMG